MVVELKKLWNHPAIKTRAFFRLLITCTLLASIIFPVLAYDASLAQPLIISKTLCFLVLVLIALILELIFLISRNHKIKFALSKIDLALILLFAFIAINRYVFQADYGFSIRFLELLALIAFYALLRTLPKNYFPYLLLAIVLTGFLQALYGMLQLFGYYPSMHSAFNMTGNFINPGPYGGFLAVTGICALGMYLYRKELADLVRKPEKNGQFSNVNKIKEQLFSYLPLMALGVILMVVPATQSRATWLAFLAGTICLVIYKYRQVVFRLKGRFFALRRYIRLILAFSILIVAGLGLYGLFHLKAASASGRLLVWKVSANIIRQNPFTGIGYDRFQAYYMDAQAQYFKENKETNENDLADNTMYAFNEPLQFLVENGFIGFLLLLISVVVVIGVKASQKENYLKILACSILVSGFTFGLFSYPSQILPIKIVMVTAIALLARIDRKRSIFAFPKTKWDRKNRMFKTLFLILMLTSSGIILYRISIVKKSYQQWKQALMTYNYGIYDESSIEFKKAMPVLYANGEFLMQYGKCLVMAGRYQEGRKILTDAKTHLNNTVMQTSIGNAHKELKEYRKAEQAYKQAAYMVPNRFYPHYLLVRLYKISDQPEKAKAKAREILNKPVKVPSPAIEEMKREMRGIISKNR